MSKIVSMNGKVLGPCLQQTSSSELQLYNVWKWFIIHSLHMLKYSTLLNHQEGSNDFRFSILICLTDLLKGKHLKGHVCILLDTKIFWIVYMDRSPKMKYCIRLTTIQWCGAAFLYQIKILLHYTLRPLCSRERSYVIYRWCKVVFKGKEWFSAC